MPPRERRSRDRYGRDRRDRRERAPDASPSPESHGIGATDNASQLNQATTMAADSMQTHSTPRETSAHPLPLVAPETVSVPTSAPIVVPTASLAVAANASSAPSTAPSVGQLPRVQRF